MSKTKVSKEKTGDGKGKKGGKVLNWIVNILLVVCILLAFICTYTSYVTKKGSGVPSLFGYAPFSIQSESMVGEFNKGDLIISKLVTDPTTLQKGDVITFWTIINGNRVLNSHRILEIHDNESYLEFITKGDNNKYQDDMPVHQKEVVGKYVARIGGLGTVLDFLQTSQGFFIIVVLPVFAFFAFYLVEFFRALFAYQAGKTREKLAEEAGVPRKDGELVLSQEQLQEILAKALEQAGKKAAGAAQAQQDDSQKTEKGIEAASEKTEAEQTEPITAEEPTEESAASTDNGTDA